MERRRQRRPNEPQSVHTHADLQARTSAVVDSSFSRESFIHEAICSTPGIRRIPN